MREATMFVLPSLMVSNVVSLNLDE